MSTRQELEFAIRQLPGREIPALCEVLRRCFEEEPSPMPREESLLERPDHWSYAAVGADASELQKIRRKENIIGLGEPEKMDWEDALWVDSAFINCMCAGAYMPGALFVNCDFINFDLYWCFACQSVFIDCRFGCCDLRGNFDEARFVRCRFEDCETGDNALGGATQWKDSIEIECTTVNCHLPIWPPKLIGQK